MDCLRSQASGHPSLKDLFETARLEVTEELMARSEIPMITRFVETRKCDAIFDWYGDVRLIFIISTRSKNGSSLLKSHTLRNCDEMTYLYQSMTLLTCLTDIDGT